MKIISGNVGLYKQHLSALILVLPQLLFFLVDEHVPKVLIVPELTQLIPVIFKALAAYLETNPLAELLKVRSIETCQSHYCPSGYGQCTSRP